jgi:pimeloyl-ACP methyl ester carboxylesterase
MSTISTGIDARTAVTDRGAPRAATDPALLFVPGWCGDRSVFDGLVELASRERRAVSVDLPDHGDAPARPEVTTADVVDALVATVDALDLPTVVPVTLSHAGWAAIELRRRLGPERVPAVVLLDWMVLGTPPGFADALAGLQSPAWADVRAGLVGMWTDDLDLPDLHAYVGSMCRYGARHWQRAGREIAAGFAATPVPLDALAALGPCPTLHLYAQPADDAYLAAQQAHAATHPWFSPVRLEARSHFPMFEVPAEITREIGTFLAGLS